MAADEKQERRINWIAGIGIWIIRVLGSTWRYRIINDGPLKHCRATKQPLIFSLWHGHLLPLLHHHRGRACRY